MNEIVIFGAGSLAEVSHYYFSHDSEFRVAAFTLEGPDMREPEFRGLPVVAFEELEVAFPAREYGMFLAGPKHMEGFGNRERAERFELARSRGYRLVSFVSSKADVAPDLEVRPNTMIMDHSIVQPFVEIGEDTIIWSTTRIGNHARIGNHCWLSSPVIGESTSIGDFTFVGLNATIGPFLTIADRNLIGAGALITKDTEPGEVYPGHASAPSRVPSDRLPRF